MIDWKEFEPLRKLDDAVLAEIIREGEARLQAQLQIANAADQRALTLAGFQITGATAALAGGVALALNSSTDFWLGSLALMFAAAMVVAASLAVSTVRPTKFSIPGNNPMGWLPDRWLADRSKGRTLKQARIEQATCLQLAISDNVALLESAASRVRWSIDVMIVAVAGSGLMLFVTMVARSLPSDLF